MMDEENVFRIRDRHEVSGPPVETADTDGFEQCSCFIASSVLSNFLLRRHATAIAVIKTSGRGGRFLDHERYCLLPI